MSQHLDDSLSMEHQGQYGNRSLQYASTSSLERTLLIVEDDKSLSQCLARAMECHGFIVASAECLTEALSHIDKAAPAFAVVDMRLGESNGLDIVSAIKTRRSDARVIVLSGYASIATAVGAIKFGADDFLPKPVDADEVAAALLATENQRPQLAKNAKSPDDVRWEHIQQVYKLCGSNVSHTARRLSMHRRTLQRILSKGAPR